jgi:hypothetical protein
MNSLKIQWRISGQRKEKTSMLKKMRHIGIVAISSITLRLLRRSTPRNDTLINAFA